MNNSTPALNDRNLNKLQNNVEDAINEIIVTEKTTNDTSGYSCNYINNINTYSLDETLTGETWVNGKPIYRKVISGILGTNINISSLQISMLKIKDGILISNSGTTYPYPYNYNNSDLATTLEWDSLQIKTGRSNTSSSYTNGTFYITLEYTKTTD